MIMMKKQGPLLSYLRSKKAPRYLHESASSYLQSRAREVGDEPVIAVGQRQRLTILQRHEDVHYVLHHCPEALQSVAGLSRFTVRRSEERGLGPHADARHWDGIAWRRR